MNRSRSSPRLQTLCDEALALHQAGRRDEARRLYQKVLLREPAHLQALHLLGSLYAEIGESERAVDLLRRSIRIDPSVAPAHAFLGAALNNLQRFDEGLASLDAAVALAPGLGVAHYNRGVALMGLNRPGDALASFEAATLADPGDARAWSNRGAALAALGRHDEALASYDKAVALQPDYADARVNRAHALLLAGRWEEGWREYEWRWRAGGRGGETPQFARGRPWRGETNLRDKRIHVHAEQGQGDAIQFCRYLPLLEGMGAEVFVSVRESLQLLLASLSPTLTILGEDEAPPAFDYHCALMSLPLWFGTTPATVPAPARYLAAEPGRLARMADRLGPRTRPRIGIAWSGSPTHVNDRNRSIPFEALTPLLGQGFDWIALQNLIRPSDQAAFQAFGRVRFFGEALRDFADAAALIEETDLVISADTSLAHLAGALGKAVWILLPFAPDWRWLLGREDTPWYRSVRLIRQPAPGDWASVVGEAGRRLETLGLA